MMENAVTDLPEPLSPTTPTVSPRRISNATRSRALTMPSRVRNSTERPSTDKSGAAAAPDTVTSASAGR